MISKNNKGFSLIEVMTVVAIIAVVSLIAIPNYQRFQAKAKQANAKAELATMYGLEIAFNQEFGTYHSNPYFIGYTPDGYGPLTGANGCPATSGLATGPLRYYRMGFSASGTGNVTGNVTGANDPCPGVFSYGPTSNDQTLPTTMFAGNSTAGFLIGAQGIVRTGKTDVWTINPQKVLTNATVGF